MSTSFIISNVAYMDGNAATIAQWNAAGVGSWQAYSFWGYENQTVNRIMWYNAASTGTNNYTLMSGIGTVDRTIGAPSTVSGLGNSLNFNSSVLSTNLPASAFTIETIPDFTISPKQKYWFGQQIVASSGAFVHRSGFLFSNNYADGNCTSPYWNKGTGTFTFANAEFGKNLAINWGYDSGNGKTVWYNPFPGPIDLATTGSLSTSNLVGFTFTQNTDLESIFVNNVKVYLRLATGTFPTGTGTTVHCILYDTDGTTALIGHTIHTYSAQTTQTAGVTLPINYWFDKKKLYHIAFAIVNNATAANNQIVYSLMPMEWQSALGFTSQYFSKAGGASAPTYTINRVIPFYFNITKTRGHLQNSEGDVNVF